MKDVLKINDWLHKKKKPIDAEALLTELLVESIAEEVKKQRFRKKKKKK